MRHHTVSHLWEIDEDVEDSSDCVSMTRPPGNTFAVKGEQLCVKSASFPSQVSPAHKGGATSSGWKERLASERVPPNPGSAAKRLDSAATLVDSLGNPKLPVRRDTQRECPRPSDACVLVETHDTSVARHRRWLGSRLASDSAVGSKRRCAVLDSDEEPPFRRSVTDGIAMMHRRREPQDSGEMPGLFSTFFKAIQAHRKSPESFPVSERESDRSGSSSYCDLGANSASSRPQRVSLHHHSAEPGGLVSTFLDAVQQAPEPQVHADDYLG